MPTKKPFSFVLCLVLVATIHILMLYLNVSWEEGAQQQTELEKKPDWLELSFVEPPSVVQTDRSLEDSSDEVKTKRLGEFRNRVQVETRSANSGKFEPSEERETAAQDTLFPSVKDLVEKELKGTIVESRNPNALNHVRIGKRNLLNTDEVSYASYMNRIGNEIYEQWVGLANEAFSQEKKNISENLYVSKVKLLLNDKGEVLEIKTTQSSGVTSLDEAAALPFWEAVFPNPPKALFRGDLAELTFEFHFEVGTSSFLKVLNLN